MTLAGWTTEIQVLMDFLLVLPGHVVTISKDRGYLLDQSTHVPHSSVMLRHVSWRGYRKGRFPQGNIMGKRKERDN